MCQNKILIKMYKIKLINYKTILNKLEKIMLMFNFNMINNYKK